MSFVVQQWEPVVLRKHATNHPTSRAPQVSEDLAKIHKVESETMNVQQVKKEFGRKVAQLRISKGYKSQAEFAKAIQERLDVVTKLEQGTITPDTQRVLTKINRVLKLFNTEDLLKLPCKL